MDLYLFSLVLGAVGLVAMAFGGMFGGHGHQGHGHAHDAGHAAHGHSDAHAHAGGHGHAQHAGEHAAAQVRESLVALLSPRVLFSVLVGFGAVGLLVRPFLPGALTVAAAVAGGVAFELVLVRPVWNFIFRFVSRPARMLETVLFEPARAATSFDASGHGVIALEMDGEVRQLLGSLRPEDRANGVRVRAGDRLQVEEVDLARNRCVVSWIGS
jgi:hypothetical protein